MNSTGIPLLIVEDNPMYAEILQRLLPTLGADLRFAIQWVDDAEKAYAALQHGGFELVLLDYKLPGATGLDVLAHIRQLPAAKQPAVIMLTGMGSEAVAVEAMKSGAKDYLPKDNMDVPSLLRAITSALERRRLEAQVAQYTRELREKNEQMEADLAMASEIQQALLPLHYPSFGGALEFVHRYQPTGQVGGDFFDVFALSPTKAGVFLCDVMGHGVRAALVTAILRALVDELQPAAGDPGQFLTEINRRLLTILKQTRMPLFASAFYCIADAARGKLQYASAGHPAPLHVRRAAKTVEPLRGAPGPALGVFEDSTYPQAEQLLTVDDLLVLFTDGLFEVEGRDAQQFGEERLLATARQQLMLPSAALLDRFLTDVRQYSATGQFEDDVCLVGMEVKRLGA